VSPHPILRTYAAARAYCEQLRGLMDQLRADPLDESKSAALIAHIVNNRSTAAHLFDTPETPRMEAAC
jgi:hypothetical protein